MANASNENKLKNDQLITKSPESDNYLTSCPLKRGQDWQNFLK